jgi:hypothetical protein
MKSNNANVEWSDDDDSSSSSSFDDFSNVEGGGAIMTTTTATIPRPVRQGERRPYHQGRVSATLKRVHACTPMEIIAGGIAIISIATSAVAMIVVPSNIMVYAAGALSW